ncbi:MAG TPA: PAS domain S-box protein [Blastocatellia bacterium]|nr:PAS domain S-box protein [Blastocatellia bacterium]
MSNMSHILKRETNLDDRGNSRHDESKDAAGESERLLRLITDRSPVFIAYVGTDGTYKFVNKPYAERFGLRPQDIVGRTVSDVLGEGVYASLEPYVNAVLRGERCEFEMELAYREIGAHYVWVTYEPEFDEAGQINGFVATVLDITDRKQVEGRTSIEPRFSDLIVNSLPGIFYLFNDQGRFLRWNKQFEEVSEYSGEEISKMSPLDFFGEADKPMIAERIQQVFSKGEATAEADFVTKGGGRIPHFFTGRMIEFDRKPCLIGMGIDVTRRQKAEIAQSYLAAIVESCDDVIVSMSLEGAITSWNKGAEKTFGYSAEEVVGKPIRDLIPPELAQKEEEILENLRRGKSVEHYETERLRKDGSRIQISATISPIRSAKGEIVGASEIARDITERKREEGILRESEERFRALADSAPVLVWMQDATGCLFVNHAYLDFLGLDDAAVIRGYDWEQYIHPEDREAYISAYMDCLERHAPFEAECRFRRHDGEYRWMQSVAVPRLTEEGEFLGHTGCTFDVHEARMAASALREADRHKDEFLAMLAHELRNPLAPIRNATEALKRIGPPDPQLEKLRDMIGRQVTHMSRLVDDLLDVSRITRNKIELCKERLELMTVVGRAVETSRPLIDSRKHRLTVSLPPDPVEVEGDLARLSQVISNLLDNAAKYTEEGGNIFLTSEKVGGQIVISVKDDGVGIPSHILPHVFDLFTQADRSLDRSQGGLGIGLTLVHRLVELHGGNVEAHSAGPGKGSEFVIYLPVVAGEASKSKPAEPVAADGVTSLRRCRMLVVDDNVDSAESMATLLKLDGHEVRVAYDGPAAVESALAFRPQVVLLDIGLPGLDGYEVARRLRRINETKDMFLIAVTGYGKKEDRVRALTSGFNYHITKPVDPEELDMIIKKLTPSRSSVNSEASLS